MSLRRVLDATPLRRCGLRAVSTWACRSNLASQQRTAGEVRSFGSTAQATSQPKKQAVALDKIMPRDGSRSDLKILPPDPDFLRLSVQNIAEMSRTDVGNLALMLNTYGAAVLVPETEDKDGLGAYKSLDHLFGTVVGHDKQNEHGVVVINPAKPTSINTANPKKEHLPHTDDAYTESPSAFCTLQCRQAAPSGGGESVLVSGAELLASLSNEELRTLMQPGMVSMGRRPAHDGSWMKVSSIPMFWVDKDSGWLQVRWRCNDGCVSEVAAEAETSYAQMDAVARGEAQQLIVALRPGEILIVDNRAIAHGRREFLSDEPRIMWRKNYVGDGALAPELRKGMCAAYSSMFEGLHSMFDPDPFSDDDTSTLRSPARPCLDSVSTPRSPAMA